MKYLVDGRTPEQWEQCRDATSRFLAEQARLRKVTSYTEMDTVVARRVGVAPLDFHNIDERAAMADLLGDVSHRSFHEQGILLSAVVIYLNGNEPGPGFYAMATHLGTLRVGASALQREKYWVGEINRVHEHYARQAVA